MRGRVGAVLLLAAVSTIAATAQDRWFGGFDALRAPVRPATNVAYDGRFAFVRLSYQTLPGGYWYRGQPAWSHGYPTSERNLMEILQAVTSLTLHVEETSVLSLEDPAIFRYPVLYIIEVSWWQMTDAEAANLRAYLDKGGFVIVDDFKTEQWRGGRGWAQFADNMARVLPAARFVDLDISHPIFHQFFEITSLEIFPQAYNAGRPIFRGYFEGNDPAKPMRMFVDYNTDISQFWEWSGRGYRAIDETNEAYKMGVNAILYGLMH
ncbi:MAG: DUF4159 domain-containing protein [Acidobacteria bacterium]|nr:DUF4159 domain-containing protein [Acidobacteriota bacterium]